jgi:hypothetical protein
MRTTLNIPDALVKQAKRRAIDEGRTLTDLLVEGLQSRLSRSRSPRVLPVSAAASGLVPGVDWKSLEPADPKAEAYR